MSFIPLDIITFSDTFIIFFFSLCSNLAIIKQGDSCSYWTKFAFEFKINSVFLIKTLGFKSLFTKIYKYKLSTVSECANYEPSILRWEIFTQMVQTNHWPIIHNISIIFFNSSKFRYPQCVCTQIITYQYYI